MDSEMQTLETEKQHTFQKTPPVAVVGYTGLSLVAYASLMIGTIYCLEQYEPTSKDRLPMTRFMLLMLFAGALGACVSNIAKW